MVWWNHQKLKLRSEDGEENHRTPKMQTAKNVAESTSGQQFFSHPPPAPLDTAVLPTKASAKAREGACSPENIAHQVIPSRGSPTQVVKQADRMEYDGIWKSRLGCRFRKSKNRWVTSRDGDTSHYISEKDHKITVDAPGLHWSKNQEELSELFVYIEPSAAANAPLHWTVMNFCASMWLSVGC